MRILPRLLAVTVLISAFGGCDSAERTVQTARVRIVAYQAHPDQETEAAVEASLARLDAQIAEFSKKGDRVQADLFARQAASLRSDFQAAKMAKALNDAKRAIQGIGDAFKEAGKTIGEALKQPDTNSE